MYIQNTGSADKRVDIVLVAEGYTASEMERFYADARRLTDAMFAPNSLTSPYHEYQQYFNVQALFTPSSQSGYSTSSSPIDTAFDAAATLADGRGIIGNGNAVRRFVNENTTIDEQDVIIVLVNTADYGGAASGNVTWVTARHPQSIEVLLHEVGHSFAGLDDEYVDPEVAAFFPLTSTALANSVHLSTSRTDVPWSAWLGYRDELGVVGTYEGGYYRDRGVWRPTMTSKMRDYDEPFSAPQKEAIVHAIYETVGSAAHLVQLTPFVYQLDVIDPDVASIAWRDNNGRSYAFGSEPMTTFGLNVDRLSATVSDMGGFVRQGLDLLTDVITVEIDSILDEVYKLGDNLNELLDKAIAFTAEADRVVLDRLTGSFLSFGEGNDVLTLNVGHEQIEIESLSDTVMLLSSQVAGVREHLATGDLERLVFGDGRAYALNDSVVEQAYRIYQAAFARKPDDEGLGYWTDVLDRGASLVGVAQGFTESVEFVNRYGPNPSNEDFVSALYVNILGREQDAEGAAFWVDHMNAGRLQGYEVLAQFSESPENVRLLEPVLGQGVWFDSWVA
ncbi:M64 family metallopeptidase [Orrella daihaiensis]|uniref:DUF4214 domain-containing protein n=1 Tax=Orrella daihaiensis TaxID=2782176 RepID=A0ABY4AJD5_9BURK|nr:M64 family metallopeptidase [Orrella daihaiensis]UOD50398.1 DUF4214 domain-containing protein [Orrella daihaiensis]